MTEVSSSINFDLIGNTSVSKKHSAEPPSNQLLSFNLTLSNNETDRQSNSKQNVQDEAIQLKQFTESSEQKKELSANTEDFFKNFDKIFKVSFQKESQVNETHRVERQLAFEDTNIKRGTAPLGVERASVKTIKSKRRQQSKQMQSLVAIYSDVRPSKSFKIERKQPHSFMNVRKSFRISGNPRSQKIPTNSTQHIISKAIIERANQNNIFMAEMADDPLSFLAGKTIIPLKNIKSRLHGHPNIFKVPSPVRMRNLRG